jgi:peptide/nickel transport system permease protein
MTGWMRRAGLATLTVIALAALFAPALSPGPPSTQWADRVYAPPMYLHVRDATGWRAPFVYPQVLENRILRRFRDDADHPTPLIWFANGHVASIPADRGPLLLLGADRLGRDVFSRLLDGSSRSLGVAVAGTCGALIIGAFVGAVAGSRGGRVERLLMLAADVIVVLPGAYLVLVLRGLLPIVLEPDTVFVLMTGLFPGTCCRPRAGFWPCKSSCSCRRCSSRRRRCRTSGWDLSSRRRAGARCFRTPATSR